MQGATLVLAALALVLGGVGDLHPLERPAAQRLVGELDRGG
jgi:hypothetical protein